MDTMALFECQRGGLMASGGVVSKSDLLRRRSWLDYLTITWHALAAFVSIAAGITAGSIALTGFGFESVIQTALCALALWRLQLQTDRQMSKDEHFMDRTILFVLGVLFFFLALYILNESGSKLFYRERPATSSYGLILSVLAFTVMCALAALKLRTAKALDSKTLRADAWENVLRAYPSLALFFGLLLYMVYGWWWTDPVAGLLMLPFIVREGWKAIEASKGASLGSETTKTI